MKINWPRWVAIIALVIWVLMILLIGFNAEIPAGAPVNMIGG